MKTFTKKLMEWYDPATRNLPWKKTSDPYKIWLSEIILQQTRVEQGMPYYLTFVKQYPTVKKLADAPLNDVLKLWEGLGYYSRARNLHAAAKQIVQQYKGKFPTSYDDILRLKGIGNYTSAAISSFAFGLPHAVLDGNVYRLLARYLGIETPIDSTEGKKKFASLANDLLDKKNPAIYNQAIMDFGSLVCKPQNPLCNICPLSSECKALATDKISMLPVKAKKLIKTERHFHYFVIHDAKNIYIRQRVDKDIWHGLFEFPMMEIDSPKSIVNSNSLKKNITLFIHGPWTMDHRPVSYKQILSHQLIHGHFYEIKTNGLLKVKKPMLRISKGTISNHAYPKIVRSYLQDRLNFLS